VGLGNRGVRPARLALGNNPEQTAELDMPNEQSDRRHDDIGYKRLDDRAECTADHDTHRHVDHVPLDGELTKFLQKPAHDASSLDELLNIAAGEQIGTLDQGRETQEFP